MRSDMKALNEDMALADFRDEMQHRVVKYGPRSRPAKEGLRFARRHKNPEYYRVASDKVHAQEQYRREIYGPTKWETVSEFLNMGSLREVAVTLLLVSLACFGIEMTRNWLGRPNPDVSEVDVDRLAKRMGFYLSDERAQPTSEDREDETQVPPSPPSDARPGAKLDPSITEEIDRRLEQLEKALMQRTAEQNLQLTKALLESLKASSSSTAEPVEPGQATDVQPGSAISETITSSASR